ncbi:hypothetical protein GQ53DRAFT_792351 [Thozetella sp. PMI_491]|nr:hypothetical protein GQ53DRAFT_792351 [Thozetella sp. PMI_491]
MRPLRFDLEDMSASSKHRIADVDNGIQIGFGGLPEGRKDGYFEILNQWLSNCDSEHRESTCKLSMRGLSTNSASKRLPTRLIDVGEIGDPTIRLWETSADDVGEWMALSYQWGAGPHFFTNRGNLAQHISGMEYATLPPTFKDAVVVTRALKRRYLWIDSICIIQGKDDDFNDEAKWMEEVYSGAYCVLAASRAAGHYSGFLQARNARDYVTLRRKTQEAPFYFCEMIDDFDRHVLQEHALARRTIFFTEHQTYWECGGGVRCETMTKMSNNLAAFLGDPNFPQIVIDARQWEKILRYQDFYRKYSRLGLTNLYDRPLAIDGLQQRLLRAMKAKGGFGVFDEGVNKGLLRRSLLWHRGSDITSLSRIKFPSDCAISAVPSWSWMSYAGGIDYLSLEFGGIAWEDVVSPWFRNMDGRPRTERREANITLTAVACDFDSAGAMTDEGWLIFDCPGGSMQLETKCVVLGKQNGPAHIEDQRHYMLLVAPTMTLDCDGNKIYERVGAGYLPGRHVSSQWITVNIH